MAQKYIVKVSIHWRELDMCKGKILEFTESLRHECTYKTMLEAWRLCGSNLEWHANCPKFMQLSQKIILIPSSISILESIFQKKLQLKATSAVGWAWIPLMLLCGSLFVGLKWMQWIGLESLTFGETCKTEGFLPLNWQFLVTNPDSIWIIQNINFSK